MANVTLDVTYNFGIQEYSPFNDHTQEVFQGCPVMKDGYLWVSEKPGWGIEVDEKAATKFPFTAGRNNLNGGWGRSGAATAPSSSSENRPLRRAL